MRIISESTLQRMLDGDTSYKDDITYGDYLMMKGIVEDIKAGVSKDTLSLAINMRLHPNQISLAPRGAVLENVPCGSCGGGQVL